MMSISLSPALVLEFLLLLPLYIATRSRVLPTTSMLDRERCAPDRLAPALNVVLLLVLHTRAPPAMLPNQAPRRLNVPAVVAANRRAAVALLASSWSAASVSPTLATLLLWPRVRVKTRDLADRDLPRAVLASPPSARFLVLALLTPVLLRSRANVHWTARAPVKHAPPLALVAFLVFAISVASARPIRAIPLPNLPVRLLALVRALLALPLARVA